MTHRFPVRVYYEDTDLGQVVYYANYLRFIERARSEWLRAGGIDQLALMQRDGIAFVARRVNADYLSPARYDDLLDVVSDLRGIHGARIALTQRVERAGRVLFSAEVDLVCVAVPSMRPVRVPAAVRAALGQGEPAGAPPT
ncbi:tol-pal system-associated acyl-CoA thioesterase [Paracoccus marinus]|uniref:tol-pal system-associated acyl-CoA thioesterase n=1 Tax=Paracoccus marinus TaxID=288426 RepID=UPI0010386435|nr:tol-pal system-associated acyl-CoA thioesterase [Paracoccus marinus]GLS81105.1 tol-pal system-associated acyl-CoA thioesterase [Paracoccus marinus]